MAKRKFELGDRVSVVGFICGVDEADTNGEVYLVRVGWRINSIWFRESELTKVKRRNGK